MLQTKALCCGVVTLRLLAMLDTSEGSFVELATSSLLAWHRTSEGYVRRQHFMTRHVVVDSTNQRPEMQRVAHATNLSSIVSVVYPFFDVEYSHHFATIGHCVCLRCHYPNLSHILSAGGRRRLTSPPPCWPLCERFLKSRFMVKDCRDQGSGSRNSLRDVLRADGDWLAVHLRGRLSL